MAGIGLKSFKYGALTEASTLAQCTYATPAVLAGAISCSVSLDIAEAELYADDVLKEKASVIKKGTITLGIDEDDDEKFAALLGLSSASLTIEGATDAKEYISKVDDVPVAHGFGHIVTKIVGGVAKYKVEWFPKVVFKPFIPEAQTKGDSLEFKTPSVEGTIMPLADGIWEKHATFSSETAAQTYLTSLFKAAQGS